MSRYRGPRFKKIRCLGVLPGLGNVRVRRFRRRRKTKRYQMFLEAKQRLRFHYGITERQLFKYVRIALKAKGETGQVLLQLLEMRLDNILFRLGMAPTIPGARQLVNHRHILVNGRIVDIPSYRCKPKDLIMLRDEKRSKTLIQKSLHSSYRSRKRLPQPQHLSLRRSPYRVFVNGIIDRSGVSLKINELLVVEYFARRI
uniref:Small ribosomal subunit protein uS4c n=1 Tax=Drosera indica TaxID=16680 RepID=A0A411K3B3_9CARY|nr:ribosomal protein S4 [Drosera indica]